MGGVLLLVCNIQIALILCSVHFLHPSQSFNKLHGNYNEAEKVPLTVIVPDPSPELSPLAAPPPISGADDLPRLPSEGRRSSSPSYSAGTPAMPFEPSAGPVSGPAVSEAPSPSSGNGTPFISSNPAVPLPTGVTDTATILPMPAPGDERQDVGVATLAQAGMMPLVVCVIMLSFWAL